MEADEWEAAPTTERGAEPDGAGDRPRLRLASAVMFVRDLERSIRFYRELLALQISVQENTGALLVSPDGFQLYLRSMGPRAHHSLGNIGIQYLIWTAEDEDDLHRCEEVLRAWSGSVRRLAVDGFVVVEGRGPDGIPVLVTYPGPDEVPRQQILRRFYQW